MEVNKKDLKEIHGEVIAIKEMLYNCFRRLREIDNLLSFYEREYKEQ